MLNILRISRFVVPVNAYGQNAFSMAYDNRKYEFSETAFVDDAVCCCV